MKFFQKIFFIHVLLLISCLPLKPTGAGLILYRYDKQGEPLFLMALDSYQLSPLRQGFEFPAGTICDHSIDQCDSVKMQSKDFLRGGIREGMEELVFGPVFHSTNLGISGTAYDIAARKINENYEKLVVNKFYTEIMNQGMLYLFKQQVSSKFPVIPKNQFALFFCDITSFYKNGLLEAIKEQRNALLKAKFDIFDIGAEPDQFAWVKGSVLKDAILKASKPVQVIAEKVVNDTGVLLNQKIVISDACFGMIRDRSSDTQNPQPNEYHVYDGKSSSMLAVLDVLLKKSKAMALPAPATKIFKPTLSDFKNKLDACDADIMLFFKNKEKDLMALAQRLDIEKEYKDLVRTDSNFWNVFRLKADEVLNRMQNNPQSAIARLLQLLKKIFYQLKDW